MKRATARDAILAPVHIGAELVLLILVLGLQLVAFGALDAAGLLAAVPREVLAAVNATIAGPLALGALALGARFVERRPVAETGIVRRNVLGGLALGFMAGAGLIGLVISVMTVAGWYRVRSVEPLDAVFAALLLNAVSFLGSAVVEEVIGRGIMFRLLERATGSWLAVALSAAAFGALHLANPNATPIGAIAIALTAGLILAGVFMATRSLWPVIGLHAGWNLFEGPIFGTPISGLSPTESWVHATVSGPELWTGGAFGPEASLVAVIVGSAAGVAALAVAARRGQIVPAPWWRRAAPHEAAGRAFDAQPPPRGRIR